ncbi:MAG TPA: MBOAT family O-acyltransferase [Urbifossiella sp.]|jgi:D-alanyl-lipoteichoic acid acyltransferase DltB (MBOAT superfamily)|nr:MBOAT family O-acyltransferase [Urbifossiella sp.]
MLFTSGSFAVLLLIVLPLYYLLRVRGQNILLLVASYVFYGWWDWRFLFLLFFSTALDYAVGLALEAPRFARHRRRLLVASIATQLGLLGVFKYFDFFAGSLAALLARLGLEADPVTLRLVLPVGISFYTFHTISYTVDIYRRLAKPTTDFAAFALFVSFFPQLVAGPIARASHLLPQCLHPRHTTAAQFYEGGYFFLWGLFKKVVVADNLGAIADRSFTDPGALNAFSALVAVYAFAWQIYCDFSGYTDMARGCAKWFGFELVVNFAVPYLAVDPADFWRRWHISLSTWLRDYLYIPLGGSRGGPARTYANLMLTMLLGGLWHGASWTFVLWGLYHGLLLVAYRVAAPDLSARRRSAFGRVAHQVFFFHLVCVGWVLFRAASFENLMDFLAAFGRAPVPAWGLAARLGYALPVFALEYLIYRTGDQGAFLRLPWWVRAGAYVVIYWALVAVGRWGGEGFIYFQF